MSDIQAKIPTPEEPARNGKQRRPSTESAFDLRRHGLKFILGLTLLIALNFGAWWFFVRPLQQRIDEREQAKQSAEQSESTSVKRLEDIRSVHARTLEVKEGINLFFDEMLSLQKVRMVPFMAAIYDVGRELKVRPERMAVNRDQLEAEGIDVFSLTFPLHGGYENLRHVLERLEHLDQFLIIREVALRSGKEGGRDLQLDVAVETYFNVPGMREELERQRLWKKKNKKRTTRRRRG